MSIFTIAHQGLHDLPLIFRALLKRAYLAKDWSCLTEPLSFQKQDNCIILVNGPSLEKDLASLSKAERQDSDIVCVNYTALTDAFFQIKPNLYAFADPMFWRQDVTSEFSKKNDALFKVFDSVDWPITFLIPKEGVEIIKQKMKKNTLHNFVVIPANIAPVKNERLFSLMLDYTVCTPQFGNVLVLSLYYAIMQKYKSIYIYGADFDVFKQLQTDQITNTVYSGGIHFYDKSYKPEINKYLDRPNKMMHVRLEQVRNAFYQIYLLSILAHRRGIFLQNRSSFSLIDSLPRSGK